MPEDFQQTVDLRGRDAMHCVSTPAGRPAPLKKIVTPLEKIYQTGQDDEAISDMQKINRPGRDARPRVSAPWRAAAPKMVIFILAIVVLGVTVYFLFFKGKGAAVNPEAKDWYAVKLVDGEIFYGQIADVRADPVVIVNVYYNYDQAKQKAEAKDQTKAIEEAGNLRLVKRGKETHGPDGSMAVVRAQVLFMEPLKADSKVLKAILEYEK